MRETQSGGLAPVPWTAFDAVAIWLLDMVGGTIIIFFMYTFLPDRVVDALPTGSLLMAVAVVFWIGHRYSSHLALVAGTRPVNASIVAVVVGSFLLGTLWVALVRSPLVVFDLLVQREWPDLSLYARTWFEVLTGDPMEEVDTVLLAPVAEEMLYRGVLFQALLRRWGVWPAAVVSSLVFAVLHFDLSGVMLVLRLFGDVPFGIVAAMLFKRSGSLAPAIAFHAGANAGLPILY